MMWQKSAQIFCAKKSDSHHILACVVPRSSPRPISGSANDGHKPHKPKSDSCPKRIEWRNWSGQQQQHAIKYLPSTLLSHSVWFTPRVPAIPPGVTLTGWVFLFLTARNTVEIWWIVNNYETGDRVTAMVLLWIYCLLFNVCFKFILDPV